MKRIFIIFCTSCFVASSLFAQREAGDVRRGNKEYNKQDYTKAEVDYRRGLEANKNSYEAHYNLGDALFKQDKYGDAQTEFETAAKMLDPKKDKERYANMGPLRAQIVHGNNPEGVEFIKKKAAEELNCTFDETVPVAPALGAHTGPSLAGIIVGPQALFNDLY